MLTAEVARTILARGGGADAEFEGFLPCLGLGGHRALARCPGKAVTTVPQRPAHMRRAPDLLLEHSLLLQFYNLPDCIF